MTNDWLKAIFSKIKNELPPANSPNSCILNISQMAAIDMSILKMYIKMHSTIFFFSHLKKYKTCHSKMLRVLPKYLVYYSQMFFHFLLTIR